MRTKTQHYVALLLILCGMCGSIASANELSWQELEEVVVVGSRPSEWSADDILSIMHEAKELLAKEELTPRGYRSVTVRKTTGRGKNRKVVPVRYDMPTGRPVLLAGWSKRERRWHIITMELPCPAPKCWHGAWTKDKPPIKPVWVPPGYSIEHVRGSGRLHFEFRVSYLGERLWVMGWKYPDFDTKERDVWKPDWRSILRTAEITTDLPYTEDTYHPEFETRGRREVRALVKESYDELRAKGVMSKAFPGKLVVDVVPAYLMETIPLIEQSDAHWPLPNEVRRVLHRIGMYGPGVFSRSVSNKSASGLMQFTSPTYRVVVRRYSTAQLNPDFVGGVRDGRNAVMAATCLMDLELAGMTPAVRTNFLANPRVYAVYTVVAYNAGPRVRRRFYSFVLTATRKNITRLREPPDVGAVLDSRCPCLYVEHGGSVTVVRFPRGYNTESGGYTQKYNYVLKAEHSQEDIEP